MTKENKQYTAPCPFDKKTPCVQTPTGCGCDPCEECEVKLACKDIKVTYATNFLRVFRLPEKFPSDFCFGDGHPTNFQLVDWFNPFDQLELTNINSNKEFNSASYEYQKHIEKLRTFIKEKKYFNSAYTYMVLTDYGDVFLVNPEKKADELQKEFEALQK